MSPIVAAFAVLGFILQPNTPMLGSAPGHSGRAQWPLTPQPAVVSGFDPPEQDWQPGHRGVDLSGSTGQRVLSALGGTIAFAGSIAGRGVVVVSHGNLRTTYEPVQAAVGVGQRVLAGEFLGTLQSGGSHCVPQSCLHWGLREGATYLDPLSLLGGGPVRLLPLSP